MNTNSVISPVTLVFPKLVGPRIPGRKGKPGLALKLEDLEACLQLASGRSADQGGRAVLASSIEAYLRCLLTHCAVSIHIPAFADPKWHSPRIVKSLLVPTTRKHIVFVDRRGALWDATCQFLSPVSQASADDKSLSELAWDLYMLVLATRYKGEAVVSPERFIANAARLDNSPSIPAEGRARLARLVGLLQLFDTGRVAPSFRVRPDVGPQEVSRRIDEILEDAYLLEASQLRRMFGLKQNVTSIRRDLRKLLEFIAKSRSWARGLVSLSSTQLIGGNYGLKVMETLLDMLPVLEGSLSQPVLTRMDTNLDFATAGCVRVVRTISGDWCYRFEGNEPPDTPNNRIHPTSVRRTAPPPRG